MVMASIAAAALVTVIGTALSNNQKVSNMKSQLEKYTTTYAGAQVMKNLMTL